VTRRDPGTADAVWSRVWRVITVRVQVFHQDELFADAVAGVLASEDIHVTNVRSLTEAVRTASAEDDAVLIDMRADGALTAVRTLSTQYPRLRVLGYLEGDDPRQVAAAQKAGVTGWVSTADSVDRLMHLLRRPAASTPADRRAVRPTRTARGRYQLTAREEEVLDRLARGASTDALACSLHVSPATARTHVHNVLAKLGVHTRLEAVAYAIEHQLVDVDDLLNDDDGHDPEV
jgi:two-component system nitrate/nitrite response regulator NarL